MTAILPAVKKEFPPKGVALPRAGWLEAASRRVCLLDIDIFWHALRQVASSHDSDSAERFLYQVGQQTGQQWGNLLVGLTSEQRLEHGLQQLQSFGLGSFERLDSSLTNSLIAAERQTVLGHDTIEAWQAIRAPRTARAPVCVFAAGLLAGLWNVATDPDPRIKSYLTCWEVECAALGAPQCRFELGAAATLTAAGFQDPLGEPLSATIVPSDAGRHTFASVSWNDWFTSLPTDRQWEQLHQELAQRQAAYQRLLDNMNDALLVLDAENKLLFCNRQFTELMGLDRDELQGVCLISYIHENDRERVEKTLRELLSRELQSQTFTFRLFPPNGQQRTLEASARLLLEPNELVGVELICRDITQRERDRQELLTAHAALLRKQRTSDLDLRMAKRVHESLLPKSVSTDELDVGVLYAPAHRVGGDYCHVAFPYSRACVVTICDVSGHGMAAALLAARVNSHIRQLCEAKPDPLTITREVDTFLRSHFEDTGLFLTMFTVAIDLDTFQMKYCGAGHPGPLLLRRATGQVEMLESQNLPIGVLPNVFRDPPIGQTRLCRGDRLILYTDGVTETIRPDHQIVGVHGLSAWIADTSAVPIFELGGELLQRMEDFRGERPPQDDVTMLLLEAKTSLLPAL